MLPVADSVYGLAVNDSLLARFGVTEPVTWDEFRGAVESASSRAEGIAGYAVPLSVYSPELVQQHVLGWLWCGNGGSVVKDGFPDVVNDKHRETVAFLKRLYDGRWLLPESFTENTLDAMDEFANSRLSALTGLFPANSEAAVDRDALDEHVRIFHDLYQNAQGFVHEMAEMRVADNLMSIYVDEFQSYMHGRIGADEMMENIQRLWMENY
jgi:multiple sugar transport system substrate-binding protein